MREREIVGCGRGSGRGGEMRVGVCVRDQESRGWERRERGIGVCICKRESLGDGKVERERETRLWERRERGGMGVCVSVKEIV